MMSLFIRFIVMQGTDVTLDQFQGISSSRYVEQLDDNQVGYGLRGVASTVISATSDWGATVKIFEVQSIAEALTLMPCGVFLVTNTEFSLIHLC